MNITENDLRQNNARILSAFDVQERYALQKKKMPNKPKATEKIKGWLRKVCPFQYRKTITEICELTRTPNSTGSTINKAAEEQKLITVLKDGNKRYPVLTEDGYAMLGDKPEKFHGRGAGQYHVFYQYRLQDHLWYFRPVIELQRKGRFTDIGIQLRDCSLICIEIAMTSNNERSNILKAVHDMKAQLVIVSCHSDKIKKEVEEIVFEMKESVRNKVLICKTSDLLAMDPKDFLSSIGMAE